VSLGAAPFTTPLEKRQTVVLLMRTEGPNFLQRNSALAEEICRTFVDLDDVEKELKKAAKAIDVASGLTAKYRVRLQALCEKPHHQNHSPRIEKRECPPRLQELRTASA
jgi:hypothetical protein